MNSDNSPCHSYLLYFISQLQSRNSNIVHYCSFVDLSLKKSWQWFYIRHYFPHGIFQIFINTSSYAERPWNPLHPLQLELQHGPLVSTAPVHFAHYLRTLESIQDQVSGFQLPKTSTSCQIILLYYTTLHHTIPSWTRMSKSYSSNCGAKQTRCYRKERLSTYPKESVT